MLNFMIFSHLSSFIHWHSIKIILPLFSTVIFVSIISVPDNQSQFSVWKLTIFQEKSTHIVLQNIFEWLCTGLPEVKWHLSSKHSSVNIYYKASRYYLFKKLTLYVLFCLTWFLCNGIFHAIFYFNKWYISSQQTEPIYLTNCFSCTVSSLKVMVYISLIKKCLTYLWN